MSDDYYDPREGFDRNGRRTSYDEEGDPHYEYNAFYDEASKQKSSGGSYRRSSGPASDGIIGAVFGLVFKIAGFLFLKLPFVLVGALAGYLVWTRFNLAWQIAAALGLGVFLLVLYLTGLYSKLVGKMLPPLSWFGKLVEFILVAGLQFLIVLAFSFSVFMPRDVQKQLVSEQASHFQKLDITSTITGVDTRDLQNQFSSGALTADQFLKKLSDGAKPGEMLPLFVESQGVYYMSMFAILKGGAGFRVWLGLILPLLLASAVAFVIYQMHLSRYR